LTELRVPVTRAALRRAFTMGGRAAPPGEPRSAPVMGFAEVLSARRRLAEIASGSAVLLHTHRLGQFVRTADHARDLLRRVAQARMILGYGLGAAVSHVDTVADWACGPRGDDPATLIRDVAATGRHRDSDVVLAEELAGEPALGDRHDEVLRYLLRATKFVRACTSGPVPDRAPLVCRPAGGAAVSPTGAVPGYDPSAHLLWVGSPDRLSARSAGRLGRLANPLVLDIGDRAAVPRTVALCEQLDPDRWPGRLVLRVPLPGPGDASADLAARLDAAGHQTVWLVQPERGPAERLGGIYVDGDPDTPADPYRRHLHLVRSALLFVGAVLGRGGRGAR
jgi:3-deoxy-D-arabino-heptulosonate 7-phosphate (DAHP) synthase class II